MTMFQMYLFTRADKLLNLFGTASGVLLFVFALSTLSFVLSYVDGYNDTEKRLTKWFFFSSLPLFLFSIAGYVLTPSQKELAAIVVVPKILSAENVEKIQKIGADGVDIVKLATEYTKGILENKTKEIEK